MIFDAMCRVVRSFLISGSSMSMEIASFAPGGYSLRVEAPDGPIVRRFAKDRTRGLSCSKGPHHA